MVDARQMRRSIDARTDPRMILEAQFQMKNGPKPTSPPTIITGDGTLVHSDGESTPSVKLEPPSPINLAASPTKFVPPPPPPPLPVNAVPPISPPAAVAPVPAPVPAPVETPKSPSTKEDAPISAGPTNLSRTGSGQETRMRGPRIAPTRGGGPRPLSLAGAAKPSVGVPTRSPRNSISSVGGPVGRSGSPISETRQAIRPRTPPDARDYAPSKRGGRAAAGSFSRTRPSEGPQ